MALYDRDAARAATGQRGQRGQPGQPDNERNELRAGWRATDGTHAAACGPIVVPSNIAPLRPPRRRLGPRRPARYPSSVRAVELLGRSGPLAQAIEGYEHRESQLSMTELVEQTLAHRGVALIEAGTGTGKTLAYLVPALLSGQKVVISTHTRALQDQIMESDLPALEKHLGLPVKAACMKGLSNYVCRRRTAELLRSPDASEPRIARRLPVFREWLERTEVADRAELASIPEQDPLWAAVESSSETRIGPRCRHFEECFVTRMRRRAEQAQLLVVNHHLFFADLAMRAPSGTGILPAYDAVVFDEAHRVEDVATRFFGRQVSESALARLVGDAERALLAVNRLDDGADRVLAGVQRTGERFFDQLPVRTEEGRLELPDGLFEGDGAAAFHRFDAALEALARHFDHEAERHDGLAQIARRATRVRNDAAQIAERTSGGQVTWFETRERSRAIGESPVDISALFREDVLLRVPSVVLTSATLTTGGSFDFIKRRLGIDYEIDEVSLPSPFDYPSQAALYLPELPDPRAPNWPEAAVDEVVRLARLTSGGAFVLCTSFRMMSRLAERCRPTLRGRPIYVQGEAPKRALLERFRADGDALLFATMSFWEGVDVPGDALRLVIVDKLPFAVPSDPLVEARCRQIEEEGDRAFIRYLVPSAALLLKQAFGRLIRARTDRGVVAVLDARLRTKGYGQVFLRSLPDATRCDTFDAVERFWQDAQ